MADWDLEAKADRLAHINIKEEVKKITIETAVLSAFGPILAVPIYIYTHDANAFVYCTAISTGVNIPLGAGRYYRLKNKIKSFLSKGA